MRIEVLISCMHQPDASIVRRANVQTDAVVVNQCDREGEETVEFRNRRGEVCRARIIHTRERGLSRSRNMALAHATADVCLLCDDDEVLADDYAEKIGEAYEKYPDAAIVAFALRREKKKYATQWRRVGFVEAMKISSVQISFRLTPIRSRQILFDTMMGSGTGNGAGEEVKFLFDNLRASHKIYYAPLVIGSVSDESSSWFSGYDARAMQNLGWSSRRILGCCGALFYAVYWPLKHHHLYASGMSRCRAIVLFLQGIFRKRTAKE